MCRSHARPHDSQKRPEHEPSGVFLSPPNPPPCPPASEAPHHGLTLGGIIPKQWRITSRHLLCGRLHPSGVNWHSNLWTTSKQTNITSGLTVFLCSECRHNIAVAAELIVALFFNLARQMEPNSLELVHQSILGKSQYKNF